MIEYMYIIVNPLLSKTIGEMGTILDNLLNFLGQHVNNIIGFATLIITAVGLFGAIYGIWVTSNEYKKAEKFKRELHEKEVEEKSNDRILTLIDKAYSNDNQEKVNAISRIPAYFNKKPQQSFFDKNYNSDDEYRQEYFNTIPYLEDAICTIINVLEDLSENITEIRIKQKVSEYSVSQLEKVCSEALSRINKQTSLVVSIYDKQSKEYIKKEISLIHLNKKDLKYLCFYKINLSFVNFERTDLSNCFFKEADLTKCKFFNSILNRANFNSSILFQADFRGSEIVEADFTLTDMEESNLYITNLYGSVFIRTNLYKTILPEILENVVFKSAYLVHTKFNKNNPYSRIDNCEFNKCIIDLNNFAFIKNNSTSTSRMNYKFENISNDMRSVLTKYPYHYNRHNSDIGMLVTEELLI